MLKQRQAPLDRLFLALADPTRRVILEHLSRGSASVSDLAAPMTMSLPAVLQHVQVLHGCDVVTSSKVGRIRTCHINLDAFRPAERWMEGRRRSWEHRLDRLANHLGETDG